jgi:hypothetical protein
MLTFHATVECPLTYHKGTLVVTILSDLSIGSQRARTRNTSTLARLLHLWHGTSRTSFSVTAIFPAATCGSRSERPSVSNVWLRLSVQTTDSKLNIPMWRLARQRWYATMPPAHYVHHCSTLKKDSIESGITLVAGSKFSEPVSKSWLWLKGPVTAFNHMTGAWQWWLECSRPGRRLGYDIG